VRLAIAVLMSTVVLATPAHAEWWEAKTDHFIVYSETSAANAKEFAEKMERLDMSLRSLQNIKFSPATSDSRKLTVFRYGDTGDINWIYTLGRGNAGIAGFYMPNLSGSISFTPAKSDTKSTGDLLGARGKSSKTELDPEKVLFHEYTHHFMYQHFTAAYPSWYSEGFAETAATIVLKPDGSFHLGDPPQYRAEALFFGMMNVSAERLLARTNKPTGEDQYGWYTIGWLLNHYLTFEPSRKGQLQQYLRMINDGTPPPEAARKAFGDLDLLNRQITKYKSGKLPGVDVKIANFSPPTVAMRKLGPDEEAIMKVKMRSKRGVDKKLALRLADDARAIAQKYPNSYAVQLALAEAEFDVGSFQEANLPRAEAAADRALAIRPDSAEAMIFKGRSILERGTTNKALLPNARTWFAKAYKADPEHPAPLFYNYLTYFEAGGAIPESALIGLEKAYDMARHDHELKFVLARQLLGEKKGDLARSILMPYAISPHESKGSKKMREVVDLIEAKKVDEAYKLLAGEMAEAERKRKAGEDD
jgi:tetratricopeptide (TPR) repeat protein